MIKFVKLGDVCLVRRGTTITRKQTKKGNVPVIAGGRKATYFHSEHNRESGTITVSGSGASAGLVNYWSIPIFASDCSTVELKDNKQNAKFIYYYMQSMQEFIYKDMRSGAAQPHVYAKDIANLNFPLFSLEEQKRIVAKLDAVFAEIDKVISIKNKKINNITSLNKKIIDNHFLGFKEKILFDKIVLSKGTGLEKSSRLQSIDKTFPYLKMNNINKDNQINIKKFVSVDAKKEEIEKYSLKKGDFLFNTRNSTELVGKSAVFNEEGTWLFNNNILRVKFKPEFSSKFVNFFLTTTLGKTYLEKMKTGTTNVAAIYYKDLRTLKIPLTTAETQKNIVREVP